jgi:hypothetical protein
MWIWQVIPFAMFAAVAGLSFVVRRNMNARARVYYTQAIGNLRFQCSTMLLPDESEPACIVALVRKTFSGRLFLVGLTNKRLFMSEGGEPPRSFELGREASLSFVRKRFTDHGNTTITITDGWEARIQLPAGEQHVCRVYESLEGYPEQALALPSYLASFERC